MATRTRARSGNNNVPLLAISLAVVVFCAASTTAVAAAVKTPPQMTTNDDDDGSGAAAAKAAGLSVDFHAAGCPDLDDIVRSSVEEARKGDAQAVTAGLLRIFFHDCFPQGCDASLLLDKTQAGSEQNMPQNKGLQQVALDLVETIRGRVHGRCRATVSCADILALATSHAVKQAGGPFIPMELGRNDSRRPAAWAVGGLPAPTDNFQALSRSFAGKNPPLNGMDVVALSGAHTVGMARCSSFKDRIDKPSGAKDNFEWGLTGYCSNVDMEKTKHAFDSSPSTFDNQYFVELKNGRGLLTSDQGLYSDPGSRWLVERYAASQDEFFNGFKESMLRLSRLRGSDPGPVRNNCFRTSFGTNLLVSVPETTADDEDLVLAAAA